MKTLIYQVWEGNILPGAKLSINHIKEYADRIGADHWFDHNPGIGYRKTGVQKYWEWLNPLWKDEFLEYDKVAVLDLDIYTVKDLNENIFDEDFGHFSIADEPHTPYKRKANPNGSGYVSSGSAVIGCYNPTNSVSEVFEYTAKARTATEGRGAGRNYRPC